MSAVAVQLFRSLLKARRTFGAAHIPFVGIVGFDIPPALDVQPQLATAVRGTPGSRAGAPLSAADGFRALRAVQQQLAVLRDTEEETREALRCWSQLCHTWAARLAAQGSPAVHAAAGSPAWAGASAPSSLPPLHRSLQQLSAAMEEGALLVERLYDANHLSLEDFDELDEPTVSGPAGPAGPGAGPEAAQAGPGPEEVQPSVEEAYGRLYGGMYDRLPAHLHSDHAAAARQQLDELAAAVAAAHPGLFPAAGTRGRGGGSAGTGGAQRQGHGSPAHPLEGSELLRAQLEAISQELFQVHKFKYAPVEWVYDGVAPALLPYVLRRRRGVPLSLAVLYAGVARRLGVAAVPVRAAGAALNVAEGPALLQDLPPEVAVRQAGRALAVTPSIDDWLVATLPAPAPLAAAAAAPEPATAAPAAGAQAAGQGAEAVSESRAAAAGQAAEAGELWVDVGRRGRVMSPAEARQRYVDLPPGPLAAMLPPSPVPLWAATARLVQTAHMRRGESDLVAYWLVQVLSLDHTAPEWAVMLPQGS
ncbi:hypothetical protein HYH03_016859 [Edaphochlamys debaryana]|uniref:Protein SirB1 N-terminal domain-containing protein n=1 Tax=Edaphochlamys debaryana TaxID=47281 RepID=A0A836BPU5_9CHLO|nr:hypothetical protein HYH03_016859 [Edaphochlamys debaryana]|eukprot:KAG2484317.1 hypothetical protein HYH03_016859 [Edaphochlamys debaryana]